MMTTKELKMTIDPTKPWPFPIDNGVRTEESKKLLEVSHKRQRDDCQDLPDAPF